MIIRYHLLLQTVKPTCLVLEHRSSLLRFLRRHLAATFLLGHVEEWCYLTEMKNAYAAQNSLLLTQCLVSTSDKTSAHHFRIWCPPYAISDPFHF